MNAIIFYLTAFGYIDGEFDFTEKTFVRIYIRQLVTARAKAADARRRRRRPATRSSRKFVAHFHEVFEQIDRQVKALFDEAVADGEDVEKFVYAKLKLRSYEIFQSFDRDNQNELLVDDRRADLRRRHASTRREAKFRDEIEALLDAAMPLVDADIEVVPTKQVAIDEPRGGSRPRADDHPFFAQVRAALLGRSRRASSSRSQADLDLMQPLRRAARRAARRPAPASSPASRTSRDFAGSDAVPRRPRLRAPGQARARVYELHRARRSARLLQLPQGRAAPGRLLREARGVEARPRASPSPSSSCSATTSIAACSATTACCAR